MLRRFVPLVAAIALLALEAPSPLRAAPRSPSRFRVEATPGASLLVHGTYPRYTSSCTGEVVEPVLHERYRGAVEVARSSDGDLYLVGELPFEDYLKGIAEVPRSWPIEALKAQVVAARSYALSQLDPDGEYDLCATDACQVYMGMGIEAGAWGERWVRAVEETAGEVILHEGEPAVTYYSSTSNGRTYDGEDVFGGGPLPYLRGIRETEDGASPLARWEVTLPFGDLARFLSAADAWPGGPIRRVEQIGGSVSMVGRRRITLSREGLRDELNSVASCLEPDSYPTTEPNGYRLPQTVPSRWYRAEQDGEVLVLRGRGWGHGVGLVQWGAYGKAKRGIAYDDILAAFYGGFRPQPFDAPPTIRVLLASDLTSVTIVPSGEAETNWPRAPRAPWRVTLGRRVRVERGAEPPPELAVRAFRAEERAAPGEPLEASLRMESSVRIRLEVLREGRVVAETGWRSFEDPVARIRLPFPHMRIGPVEVRAAVTDGVDLIRTGTRPVRVRAAPSPSPSPSATPTVTAAPTATPTAAAAPPEPETAPSAWVVPAAAGLGVLLSAGLLVLTLRRRRGFHRR